MGMGIEATDSEILFRLQGAARVGMEHDYTSIYPLNNAGLLASSPLLVGPGGKEYRGHVGAIVAEGYICDQAGARQGDVVFVSWTTYGKIDGQHHGKMTFSSSLEDALAPVNKTLRSKLSPGKGYQADEPVEITRQEVLRGLGQMEEAGYL